MMETMQQPMTRAEFEQRLHFLREQICQGKFHGMGPGIEKVRYLPNGRIDLLSINELTRLEANTLFQFRNRRFHDMLASQESLNTPANCTPEHTENMTTDTIGGEEFVGHNT
jgi:hypothetical protein